MDGAPLFAQVQLPSSTVLYSGSREYGSCVLCRCVCQQPLCHAVVAVNGALLFAQVQLPTTITSYSSGSEWATCVLCRYACQPPLSRPSVMTGGRSPLTTRSPCLLSSLGTTMWGTSSHCCGSRGSCPSTPHVSSSWYSCCVQITAHVCQVRALCRIFSAVPQYHSCNAHLAHPARSAHLAHLHPHILWLLISACIKVWPRCVADALC